MSSYALLTLAGLLSGAPTGAAGSSDEARPTVTVAPFRGPDGAACARQIAGYLDGAVPWRGRGSAAGFRTFAELSGWLSGQGRALGADMVVLGTARKRKVILEIYGTSGALLGLDKVYLARDQDGCALGARGRAHLVAFVGAAAAAWRARQAPDEAPVAASAPSPEPPPPPEPEGALSPPDLEALRDPAPVAGGGSSGRRQAAAAAAAPSEEGVLRDEGPVVSERARASGAGREPAAAPPAEPREPWIVIRPELGVTQRNLSFEGPGEFPLSVYQVSAIFTPGVRVHVRPFRDGPAWWAEPWSLDLGFRAAAPFEAPGAPGGAEVPTSYAQTRLGLAYRYRRPGQRWSAQAELAHQFLQYSLQGRGFGVPGVDTPNVAYHSVAPGLGFDVRLAAQADLRVSAAFLGVLAGGQILSDRYFGGGSAWGVQAEVALTVRIIDGLEAVVTGHYSGVSLAFDGGPVTGAQDRFTGLRLGFRLRP